jgi:hypothetical protein
MASTERGSSASYDQVLLSQARAELFSTDNSTNSVPGWRSFHTNLLILSSQADFQLTTELFQSPTSYFTSLHSTELLKTLTNNCFVASNCPEYNISARTTRKHRSSNVAFVSVAAGTCLPSCCPETGCVTLFINNLLP